MTTTRAILTAAALMIATSAWSATWFFDMGTADSKVWEGATQVTSATLYSDDAGYGWEDAEGISDQQKVWEEMGSRRGSPAPPDMWSNAITEDTVVGTQPPPA